ncbi:roadblock/LC7 domain-containing protein [Streptomyces sp. NPDC005953]|uniref:roadblock/LC7 domain-containing protein n=1 Tax=Streptomyces sp. NPDC005953 TaxID=3156719 RepID=UPI0033D17732
MTDPALDLTWFLEDFVNRLPGTRAVVVCSSDGIKLHSHGLTREGGDRVSAIVSGFASLGNSVGHIPDLDLGGGSDLHQVVVLHSGAQLLVGRAGNGALLAVVAAPDADTGQIGHEMGLLSGRVPSHLDAAARQGGAG